MITHIILRNIFFAGQITGVEGYVESISSGFVAGINAANLFNIYKENINSANTDDIFEKYNQNKITFSEKTVIGSLAKYISTEKNDFQPMNANFGILPALDVKIKDKKEKYKIMANKSLEILKNK